ncbi:hypothetical protein BKA65DRAFT_494937 [Rhexocercosporidium sp. MPI-PUGE-AT-0058]|nr:hypothetical protein BKA65DRAFT_494937 [Rhexocercosporidium sp. MPI-PUGE-AT-0058]
MQSLRSTRVCFLQILNRDLEPRSAFFQHPGVGISSMSYSVLGSLFLWVPRKSKLFSGNRCIFVLFVFLLAPSTNNLVSTAATMFRCTIVTPQKVARGVQVMVSDSRS